MLFSNAFIVANEDRLGFSGVSVPAMPNRR
jgi:hypothetical protein